jgi:phosphoglycolate phosphatase-like HAD superfamily hydrolase
MPISPLKIITFLAATAGSCYFATQTEWGRNTTSQVTDTLRTVTASYSGAETMGTLAGDSEYANHAHHEIEQLRRLDPDRYRYGQPTRQALSESAEPKPAPKLVGARVNDLREVMRFDITPDWVIQRFARVSTVLADLHLEGFRVPIVTGTRRDDIAGTLTYYFDRSDRLQRVTIHGFTGDPKRLIGTMTQYYGLAHEPSLEAGVYTKRWNGYPVHFLRLSHAPVVLAEEIHQKYTVFLELNQPNLAYGISPEARQIVDSDRKSGRW